MNKYFVNITADLDLKRDRETLSDTSTSVSGILERFHCYQSILEVQEAFDTPDNFCFHEVSKDEVRQEISRFDGTKSTPVGDIPPGMLKSTIDIHASILTKIINISLRNGCFPDDMKAAEVSKKFLLNFYQYLKKKDDFEKENYRPVSVFPHITCQRSLIGSCILKLKVFEISYRIQKKSQHPTLFNQYA